VEKPYLNGQNNDINHFTEVSKKESLKGQSALSGNPTSEIEDTGAKIYCLHAFVKAINAFGLRRRYQLHYLLT